jgi:XTP/dITP diphosphohydrolase
MKILLATHNRGKLREFAEILADLPVEWITLDDAGIREEAEETGQTFEENARIKAEFYGRLTGLPTLADDSGLEVDALDGAPGVYSARYSGANATDQDRYRLLLKNMESVPQDQRSARFRCVIALARPDGQMITADGRVEGEIGSEPRGTHGFGYDPVFWLPEYAASLAELGPEIKNKISHRARAVEAIRPALEALLA